MRLPWLALGLLLAAAPLPLASLPARAGELIRYRTPDGSIGFVDDEKRLPPGVEVLSRTPLDPPAPKPEPEPPAPEAAAAPDPVAEPLAAGAAVAPPAAAGSDADCEALGNLLEKTRCRSAREKLCSHYGLPARCTPAEVLGAEDWCARGAALREEIASFDDERDAARERLEECQRNGGMRPDCETDELDAAEDAVRTGDRRIEALEEQCHDEGCLPGWVREGCERPPES